MTDLIERLLSPSALNQQEEHELRKLAAAEIERLRAALERLANHESVHLSYVQVGEMRQIARAALEDK